MNDLQAELRETNALLTRMLDAQKASAGKIEELKLKIADPPDVEEALKDNLRQWEETRSRSRENLERSSERRVRAEQSQQLLLQALQEQTVLLRAIVQRLGE